MVRLEIEHITPLIKVRQDWVETGWHPSLDGPTDEGKLSRIGYRVSCFGRTK
ncbi:MAG: hypothetical protein WBD47_03480 [Phormidesmis sp.]